LLWCITRQSKRPSSIPFVQSRNCDNLLSSLFMLISCRNRTVNNFIAILHNGAEWQQLRADMKTKCHD
jgi:hypothetical protein